MADNMKVFNHGTGEFVIQPLFRQLVQMNPTELHYKADGDIENNPSFAIVLDNPDARVRVVAQFSLNTLQEALAELGYTLYQP